MTSVKKLKSKKKPKKPDVWVTEIRAKKTTSALESLIKLVEKYEEIS